MHNEKKQAIAIVSGGLDSITLAYLLHAEGYQLHLLSFDYGQRHKRELEFAEICAKRLQATSDIIDVSNLRRYLKGSALTDDIAVPSGHYAEATMSITVVPNRNAILLAMAYGVAVAENADIVAIGTHAGDHFIYPDCREPFINAFDAMQRLAVEGFGNPALKLIAPFLHMGKHQIVQVGTALQVPYQDTWSCYRGEAKHCGTCGTCVERREAFALAGVNDPTLYEEKE